MSERKLGEQKLFRIFLHFLDLKFFYKRIFYNIKDLHEKIVSIIGVYNDNSKKIFLYFHLIWCIGSLGEYLEIILIFFRKKI